MQDIQDNITSQAQQQALDAARAALDASYRADLADPYYEEYRRISHRTHKLWLIWSQLQLSQPIEQVQSQFKEK